MTFPDRFEDHPVWRSAAELYDRTDDFITQANTRIRNPFLDQLERAALTITSSIAAAPKRRAIGDQRASLHRARDSAEEMRSMLLLVAHRPQLHDFRPEIGNLIRLIDSCSRQITAWAESPNPGTFIRSGLRPRTGRTRRLPHPVAAASTPPPMPA